MLRKSLLIAVVCAGILLLASGCATGAKNNSQQTSVGSIPPIAGVSYFPVQKSGPAPGSANSLDLIEGKLVADSGYVRLVVLQTGESRIVIWPHGYSLDISHHTAQVLDDKGQLAAQVGDNVRLGGGTGMDFDVLDVRTGQTLPAASIEDKKPFWSAGSVNFYPLLPVYSADRLEANAFNSTMQARLVLDGGYLRLDIDSGASYLAIWPLSYTLRKNTGQLVITGKDTNGRFYFEAPPSNVFEGDRVNVRGAEVTADAVNKYIGYSLPEDWEGPFWVVTDITNID